LARQRTLARSKGLVEGGLKSTSRNRLDTCGSTRIYRVYCTVRSIKLNDEQPRFFPPPPFPTHRPL